LTARVAAARSNFLWFANRLTFNNLFRRLAQAPGDYAESRVMPERPSGPDLRVKQRNFMSIGAVAAPVPPASLAVSSVATERHPETHEHDGDGDDAKSAASPAKSVNLNGRATGQLIHTIA
jgi:hypothetical protein